MTFAVKFGLGLIDHIVEGRDVQRLILVLDVRLERVKSQMLGAPRIHIQRSAENHVDIEGSHMHRPR